MLFEFGEYCFIKLLKWKFEIKHFLLVEALARSIKMVKKKNPRVSGFLERCSIPVRLIEKSTRSIESNFQPIENRETGFLAEFFGDCSERLKRFQALLTVLWNILTLYTYLLMKHNPMGINKGLCSLENSKLERNTKNPMIILQNCYP